MRSTGHGELPARRLALRPHGGGSDVRPRPAWREVSAHLWALGPKERWGSAAGSLSEDAVGRDGRLPGQPGTWRWAFCLGPGTGAWVRRDGHDSGRASEKPSARPEPLLWSSG